MDINTAKELFEQDKSYWQDVYDDAKNDIEFSLGINQWDSKDTAKRKKRPCLTVNILPQFIHQVMNDERQNTPSINILPIGDGSDEETAKIFKGIIRGIEYNSNADEAYDTAGEYAIRGGIGFIRIDHEYADDKTLNQVLKIKGVKNPLSCWIDSGSTASDGSDAVRGWALDEITKSDFEKQYPGRQFISFGEDKPNNKAKTIIIAELFEKDVKETKKKLSDEGELIDSEEEDDSEIKTRTLTETTIRRYKFNGEEDPLEETTFPGKYIPIIPVYGEEVWSDGKRYLMSLVRGSKDAQRRLNKWLSKESEILDMAPVAPILAPLGATEDFKNEYANPDGYSVIRYRMEDTAGKKLDRPERLLPAPVPTGIVNAAQGAKDNIKETMGLYNNSIGQHANETSGVAINARKVEGDVATYHFGDNRNRSIQHVGRVLVSAIPEIYDTARVLQIIDEEENPSLVGVNGIAADKNQERHYDLTKGQYNVRVTTGASYTTKRQEAAALLSDLVKATPELMGVVGDLLFKNMDIPGADAIAARVKKTIPKELTADEDKNEPQDPEKMKMAQMIQELQAQLQQVGAELQDKNFEKDIKNKELDIKNREVGIKEVEAKAKTLEAIKVPNENRAMRKEGNVAKEDTDESIQMLEAKLVEAHQRKEQDEQNAQMQMQQQQAMQEAQMQAFQQEQEEKEEKRQQSIALMQGLMGIQQQLSGLIQVMQQPITVVRDESGAITGAV